MSEERIQQAVDATVTAQNAIATALQALPLHDPHAPEYRDLAAKLENLRERVAQRLKPRRTQSALL